MGATIGVASAQVKIISAVKALAHFKLVKDPTVEFAVFLKEGKIYRNALKQ